MLRALRADRNDHDPVWGEWREQWRGNVIDAAGDDDLVERLSVRPAVITVGVAGADGAVLAVAARDEAVIDRPRPLRQGGDDLDRPDIGRQVCRIGGLVTRSGADPHPL